MKPQHQLISETKAWSALQRHAESDIKGKDLHLRELLQDKDRNAVLTASYDNILVDFSRQMLTLQTMELLFDLAEASGVQAAIRSMVCGTKINISEKRPVLHIALRANEEEVFTVDGKNVVPEVHKVLNKINHFSENVRNGTYNSSTNVPFTDTVVIGIGGSYLGAQFVYESLKYDRDCSKASANRRLFFLANVDPTAAHNVMAQIDPARTLVIIVSKTFTTKETMLNAKTLKSFFVSKLSTSAIPKHFVAVSTNVDAAMKFGISKDNVFEMWDWVGGRYSVCSAVGLLPLSIQYSMSNMRKFLAGAKSIDEHFVTAIPRENIPLLLGLIGVWNSSFLGHPARALLPYSEGLQKLPSHIQQLDMESNGKRVAADGTTLDFDAGEIDFGEPGTNGQHSFYQLIHQGRVIPADFIGFCYSQTPIEVKGEDVTNHDELMCNFFAQPDALAIGKTIEELTKENVPVELIPHKVFPGNRPSTVLLLPYLNAYSTGQLLALFEHRTAVEGFIWGINSFDQWGVELGKKLADKVRTVLKAQRAGSKVPITGFNSSTVSQISKYITGNVSL